MGYKVKAGRITTEYSKKHNKISALVSELLFTALRAERCARLIYHTARLAAHTLRLRIHHRLIRVRRHRLIAHTELLIRRVGRLHRLPVRVHIWVVRLLGEVGTGNGDYKTDYP